MLKPGSQGGEHVCTRRAKHLENFGAIRASSAVGATVAADEVLGLVGTVLAARNSGCFGFIDTAVAGLLPAATEIRRRIEDGSARTREMAATSHHAEFMKTANHESVTKTVTRRKMT